MKKLLFLLLLALPFDSQPIHGDDFGNLIAASQALTVKIFPDAANANSPLEKLMVKMDRALTANNSNIARGSNETLIVAFAAAKILKIEPRWIALTQAEQADVISQITDSLLATNDFSPDKLLGQSSPAPQVPAQPTIAGFHMFLQSLINESGGLQPRKGITVGYRSGPLAGMDEQQGVAAAQDQWSGLSYDDKMAYEQKAKEFGDPIAAKQAATSNLHQTTGTLQNATTGEVQYINIQSQ